MSNKILGCLSEKYESLGDCGQISHTHEDYGNQISKGSYGSYQMLSEVVASYISTLKIKYPLIYNILIKHSVGSSEFDIDWKYIAQHYKDDFQKSQWEYIKFKYYDVMANRIKIKYGLDINKRSFALQNSIWSLAVQFGAYSRLFDVIYKQGMSDKDLIISLYAERGANNGMKYFKKSSQNVRNGVLNRYKNELQDCLNLLLEEQKQPIKDVVTLTDLNKEKWAIDAINELKKAGIVKNNHDLNKPITWAEFAAIINQVLKKVVLK